MVNFKKIIELFTQKIVTTLSKIWVRDPGSEILDPEKTFSGSRIQGSKRHLILDPGSGSATLLIGCKVTIKLLMVSHSISCLAIIESLSMLLLLIIKLASYFNPMAS
jgi:hypothetical protein